MSRGINIALSALISLQFLAWSFKKCKEEEIEENCGCNEVQKPTASKKYIQKKETPSKKGKRRKIITQSVPRTTKKPLSPVSKKYLQALKKWGTKEGIIDVADDELARKETKQAIVRMGQFGGELVKEYFPKIREKTRPKEDYQTWLQQEFDTTQITITNTSAEVQQISLWGTNELPTTNSTPSPPVEEQTVLSNLFIEDGVYPQGLIVNPVNGHAYIANQLSDNVSVVSSKGELITVIALDSVFPGHYSPVDVAVNNNPSSANYGYVYVAGSVANCVSIINRSYDVIDSIPVGNRPISLAYNPINDTIYVANIADDTLSVIDASNSVSTTFSTSLSPRDVEINLSNGFIYVANAAANSITVYDASHTLTTTIDTVIRPFSLAYHSDQNEMYVVENTSNQVRVITSDYTLSDPIPTGNDPHTIVYNPHNKLMYVGNKADNTYTIITPEKMIRTTLNAGTVNIGLAVHPDENLLFSTSTLTNEVTIFGYEQTTSPIQFGDSYAIKSREFTHNPILVKHAKFSLTGKGGFNPLTLKEAQVTGKKKEVRISLNATISPQHGLKVSEVYALEGSIINGANSWEYPLGGHQSLTILLYHKQLNMKNFMIKNNRFTHNNRRV